MFARWRVQTAPLLFAIALPTLGAGVLGAGVAGCGAPGAGGPDDSSTDDELVSARAMATGPGEATGSIFVPPSPTAFERGRPGLVRAIVIHDIEGSAGSAVNTFRVPGNESSAHYVVDKRGEVIQMVRERDIANHAFHSVYNAYAIGIEHEGFRAQEYPDALYAGSAKLVAELVARYRIPIDRQHIIGHHQVPKTDETVTPCPPNATTCGGRAGHADPGPNWKWDSYMARVTEAARAIGYDNRQAITDANYTLETVTPLESLRLRTDAGKIPRLIGGYWATQCQSDDPAREIAFRSIIENTGATLETRYRHPTANDCGAARDGVYPLVFNGYALSELQPVCIRRGNATYRVEKVIGPCTSGQPACLDTRTLCKAVGDDCVRTAAYPISETDAASQCH